MISINWHPVPAELRRWALMVTVALALVGACFHFIDWGLFAGGQGFAKVLWSFAAFAFVTGLTGTKLGLPAYWLWMSFVFLVGSVIGYTALSIAYFFIVTPMAWLGRFLGRDRLQLRAGDAPTFWHSLSRLNGHNPERQF